MEWLDFVEEWLPDADAEDLLQTLEEENSGDGIEHLI